MAQEGGLCLGPLLPQGVYHFSGVTIWYRAIRFTSLSLYTRERSAPCIEVGMRDHVQRTFGRIGTTTGGRAVDGSGVHGSEEEEEGKEEEEEEKEEEEEEEEGGEEKEEEEEEEKEEEESLRAGSVLL